MKSRYKITLMAAALALCTASLYAQDASIVKVSGHVTDQWGNPLFDALLSSENGANQYIANADGSYELSIRDASSYVTFTYLGFKDKKVSVEDLLGENVVVTMELDAQYEDESVALPLYNIKKKYLTGSVSTVSGKTLEKTSTLRTQESYMGRLLGLGMQEADANPSIQSQITNMNIRGAHSPRYEQHVSIILDGLLYDGHNTYDGGILNYLNPHEIESITVIRDAATQALYGLNAGDGIISITTRRGQQGEPRVLVSYEHALRGMDTKCYQPYSSYEHALMRNQAAINDGSKPIFSDIDLERYKDGTYANKNYYDEYLKPFTQFDKLYLSIGGGSDYVRYLCNFQWMHNGSPFITPSNYENPDVKNGSKADYLHVTSNLDAKLNYFISTSFTLRSDFKLENGLGTAPTDRMRVRTGDMLQHILIAAPTLVSLYAPEGAFAEGRDISGKPIFSKNSQSVGIWNISYPTNPYSELTQSGMTKSYTTYVHMDAKVNFDLEMFTKGLSGQIGFAFKGGGDKDIDYSKNSTMYQAVTNDFTFFRQAGDEVDTNGYSKYYTFCYSYEYFARLNYERTLRDHYFNAVAYANHRENISRDVGGLNNIPYRSEFWGGNLYYSYKDRYIASATLCYSGTGDFPTDHRFSFTPGFGLGWIVSNEGFLKDNKVVSFLKFRGNAGRTAREDFGQGRFSYKADITVGTWDSGYMGNPTLRPEFVDAVDFGVDLTLFNRLSITASRFKERVQNAYMVSTTYIPEFQGVALSNYTARNSGKFVNEGYELGIDYIQPIGRNVTLTLGASTSHNENEIQYIGETEKGEDYYERYATQGHPWGSIRGYRIDYEGGDAHNGFFNSQEEIESCGIDYSYLGNIRPGDFRYKDLNGDGAIDAKDIETFKYSILPQQYFSFNFGFRYKRFEISALLHGASKVYRDIGDQYSFGYGWDGIYSDLHANAWTPEKFAAGEKIDAPALSLRSASSYKTNDYYVNDGSYLKLKNVAATYVLPDNVAKRISAQEIKVTLTGQNLVTWDRMLSDYIDPETGTLSVFQPMRVVSAGVGITF